MISDFENLQAKMAAAAQTAAQEERYAQGQCGGALGASADKPREANFSDRLREDLERANATADRASARVDVCAELIILLDRNPEVRRILDLIDRLGRR